MNRKIRNEIIYSTTSLSVPYDLKVAAREHGINMSQTLVEALKQKVSACERAVTMSKVHAGGDENENRN